ncbi:MAG: hypothetical protein KME64_37655 [Scytonematopsis contorta HA4267-MV1]|jgi:hypothetical protein|nr:hypothetical protein [Scytonematopsis contorta HA4267-MV1]
MFNSRFKSQPLRLLSYGQSTSTPVAIASIVAASGTIISTLLLLINLGLTSRISSHTQGMTVIQNADGSISDGQFAAPNVRDDETIKAFISSALIDMFSWQAIIKTNEKGENTPVPDKGIEIKTESGGARKIPTKSWEAAFALTEDKNFRAEFLQKLASMVPNGVFSNEVQVSLITRHISQPRKIEDGKWEVNYIGTLVSFNSRENQGRGIPFNKTITVAAIDTPKLPKKPSELDKKIFNARQARLEITEIIDLDLGKKTRN